MICQVTFRMMNKRWKAMREMKKQDEDEEKTEKEKEKPQKVPSLNGVPEPQARLGVDPLPLWDSEKEIRMPWCVCIPDAAKLKNFRMCDHDSEFEWRDVSPYCESKTFCPHPRLSESSTSRSLERWRPSRRLREMCSSSLRRAQVWLGGGDGPMTLRYVFWLLAKDLGIWKSPCWIIYARALYLRGSLQVESNKACK